MSDGEDVQTRQLLVGAVLLFDAYVVEQLGTEEDVEVAPDVIIALLAAVTERLQKKSQGP